MAAERSCRRRNQRSTRAGVFWRTAQAVSTIMIEPSRKPISGESTMKAAILRMPLGMSPARPSEGRVAPIIPPASACDEEEGSPQTQVSRFQTMAPIRAAKTTVRTSGVPPALSCSKWTMPLPMVAATLSSAPHSTGMAEMKLKKAAQATATSGDSTRVETTVAIEFAASWKPLMKSKASATRMRATTTKIMEDLALGEGLGALRVLQDHALDHVRHVLGAIGGRLDEIDDLLPLHDDERVVPALEQLRHGVAGQRVGLVLEEVHALAGLEHDLRVLLHVPQAAHRLLHLERLRHQHRGEIPGLGEHLVDVVEAEPLGGRVGEVEHVVDAGEEPVDLGPIERGDELRVEPLEGPAGDVLGLVLAVLDGLALPGYVGDVVEEPLQLLRHLVHGRGLGLEFGEEVVRRRHQL